MELRKVLEAARAIFVRVTKLHTAYGRAQEEREEAARKADAAEGALTRANADRLVGEAGDVDLDALRSDAERARSEALLADRSVVDVRSRVQRGATDLSEAQSELNRALAGRLAQERASIALAARDALTPFGIRAEALEKISPSPWSWSSPAGAVIAQAIDALSAASASGTDVPGTAADDLDFKLFVSGQDLVRELAKLEQQLRDELSS